jgi:hypothetical protein
MSGSAAKYNFSEVLVDSEVNQNDCLMNDDIEYLGKCWAAIANGEVVEVITMRTPVNVDFSEFKEIAKHCLSMLGEVKTGHKVIIEGKQYFQQRLTHANRGKKERIPKTYIIKQ